MKRTVLAIAAISAVFTLSSAAHAANATVAADNAFALYVGNATGSNLTFVGASSGIDPDWQNAYTFNNFNVSAGDYLYVVATNYSGPAGWEGVFTTPSGTVYSNTASWVYAATNDLSLTSSEVSSATWTAAVLRNPNYWGDPVGNANASWIWSCNCDISNDTEVFRTALPVATAPVPEPETYALMVAGLGVLGFLGKRRRKSA